ncbi:serine hydrolase domain-containing protein [Peristeroidobacter soli]|uniref:serine hydrolase domain-containing protein n=1 Tax=Peristeroidobacter soli TaxID=2497877 RepID=UPI00101CB125|nr:serine hydrolase domain-containing protein [Peristeroidobacter soli]
MNRQPRNSGASSALLALILLCLPAFAQPEIPETPAGQAFADWLTSFNSADPKQVAAFNRKYRRKGDVADTLQFREYTGGLELLQLERSAPDNLLALMREGESQRGMYLEVTVKGDGRGDNLIMEIRPASLPPQFAASRLSMVDTLAALRDRATQKTAADRFSGALLFARSEQILLQQAWGYADREASRAATTETQFRLGSMNKMFTAVALLQLVDAGKLSLQGTVGQYLPYYPNRDIATKVTLHQLLTHTGGTGDIFGPEFDVHRLQLEAHADYVTLFGTRGPVFEPGSQDGYSNYGYVLLGRLIEVASGMSYYDYVQQHIYAKAGMQSTGSLPESQVVPGRSLGYTREEGRLVSNASSLPFRGMAAGGGYSTVGDLLRFAQALEAGRLLPKQLLAAATSPKNLGGGFGYGFALQGEGAMRFYGGVGGAPGMNGELRIYPELGYILVGLSNFDPPAAENMVEFFSARMPIDRR